MKRVVIFFLLAALSFLSCSCAPAEETPSPPVPPDIEGSAPPAETLAPSSSSSAEDEAEMLRVMAAGKQFVAELQNRKQPPNAREETGIDAVTAFERFFRPDTLYVSGVFVNPNMPETYICMISGFNQFNYARSVKVYFSRSEPMTWYCPMVYYSDSIDRVLAYYLGYLRDDDPEGLARWLHEGEMPDERTLDSAKRTAEYFQRHYDLSETSVKEAETLIAEAGFYSDEGFVFTIEDAAGDTFQVELGCGDGLCFPRLPAEWEMG